MKIKIFIKKHFISVLKQTILLIYITLSSPVFAHPNHDEEDIQILLYKWAKLWIASIVIA